MTWASFENGTTIGQRGSENGVIVLDEEADQGARITLERATVNAPFAITCGIYGSMVHTAFASDEAQAIAAFAVMRDRIDEMLLAPSESEYARLLHAFVEEF